MGHERDSVRKIMAALLGLSGASYAAQGIAQESASGQASQEPTEFTITRHAALERAGRQRSLWAFSAS
jgi:hypothetical protein